MSPAFLYSLLPFKMDIDVRLVSGQTWPLTLPGNTSTELRHRHPCHLTRPNTYLQLVLWVAQAVAHWLGLKVNEVESHLANLWQQIDPVTTRGRRGNLARSTFEVGNPVRALEPTPPLFKDTTDPWLPTSSHARCSHPPTVLMTLHSWTALTHLPIRVASLRISWSCQRYDAVAVPVVPGAWRSEIRFARQSCMSGLSR